MKKLLFTIAAVVTAALMSGCAAIGAGFEDFNRSWAGVSATMTTYNTDGIKMDEIVGTSFQVKRDARFDSSDGEGFSNKDSSVLSISLGDSMIGHVGSTLVLAEDGLVNIMDITGEYVTFENTEQGVPWLNRMFDNHQNLWAGTSKTIMIRSQHGTPIAVYSGNNVEVFSTDVQKSTWFRIDGKYLLVYRADYTSYENTLLER